MTLATHAIAGAAIASVIPEHPLIGFCAGFASHFLLDAIPHYDYPIYSDAIHPKKKAPMHLDAAFVRDAFDFLLDVLVGMSIAIGVFSGKAPLVAVIAGAMGGILPDPLQFVAKKIPYEPLLSLQTFHQWIHTSRRLRDEGRLILGIVSQGVLVVCILAGATYVLGGERF